MRRKMKGISIRILSLLILLFCIAGCGREEAEIQNKTEMQKKTEMRDELERQEESKTQGESKTQEEVEGQETDAAEEVTPAVKEITIDFPFDELDSYLLTLAQLEKPDGEYELRLYDETGKILQQIPCGALTEPIQFSYDILYGGSMRDLEIFPADSDTGLFFEFSTSKGRFSENAIDIPKYTEKYERDMLIVEDEQTCQTKKIYRLDVDLGYVYEVRCWKLQKDTGELKIWDNFENQSLFEGTVPLDEEGNPVNEEYYDMLFWDDRYWLRNYKEESPLRTWLDGPRTGHAEEHESREAFLADFGFQDSDPMYQYYDRYHNLQLELYKDKFSEQFCGIIYQYYFDKNETKRVEMYGFTINTVHEQEWVDEDIFSTKPVDGSDASDYVHEFEEIIEYTSFGRLDYYRCQGLAEREEDGKLAERLCTPVEINYIYHDDGTLFYRDYWHDSRMFGSTLCHLESFYDENERVIFESGYITHGELEYYYIYEDEGKMPAYCLCIDYGGGYVIPEMVRYY